LIQLVMIVPRLAPLIDGVGDYSLTMAHSLRKNYEIDTCFIVCDPEWSEASTDTIGFQYIVLKERSSHHLVHALEILIGVNPALVILQLSGYGYAKWSVYTWLVNGLKIWKREQKQCRLATFFHETFNRVGYPWQHNFWTHSFQKELARQVLRMSDFSITNTQYNLSLLQQLDATISSSIKVFPVISNVSEVLDIKPFSTKQRRLVLFGHAETRRYAYTSAIKLLEKFYHKLKISEIVDIGAPTGLDFQVITNMVVVEKGKLSSIEVSEILQDSIAGWISYSTASPGKSSVFAAYCSHGLIPIMDMRNLEDGIDGLIHGHNCILVSSNDSKYLAMDVRSIDCNLISRNAYTWYQTHNSTLQADFIKYLLLEAM
jgi:hypothetical protein